MMGAGYRAAFLAIGLLLTAPLGAGEALQMRVTPAVSMAPGFLTVRINVARVSPEDRLLQVVAESEDFYRSSEISLDGDRAPRVNVFEFRNLPTGRYQVTGVLMGVKGPRAMASGLATVARTPGR